MVNNCEVTEFKMDFLPSRTGEARRGRIRCNRKTMDKNWDMSIKIGDSREKGYSLYEIAEAILDTFTQKQQEVETIFIKISEESELIMIDKTDELESILEQLCKGFIPKGAGND